MCTICSDFMKNKMNLAQLKSNVREALENEKKSSEEKEHLDDLMDALKVAEDYLEEEIEEDDFNFDYFFMGVD